MLPRDVADGLRGIAGGTFAEVSDGVGHFQWPQPELPRRDEDALVWLVDHNAKQPKPTHAYRSDPPRLVRLYATPQKAPSLRMLPRPTRLPRRVRRVAGRPQRRPVGSRGDPHPEPVADP